MDGTFDPASHAGRLTSKESHVYFTKRPGAVRRNYVIYRLCDRTNLGSAVRAKITSDLDVLDGVSVVIANPECGDQDGIEAPRWNFSSSRKTFASGPSSWGW